MKFKFPHIDIEAIEERAVDLLLEAGAEVVPSREMLEPVLDKLVAWLDEQISYGDGLVARIVDSKDQIVMRWILGLIVDRIYKELRDTDAFSDV